MYLQEMAVLLMLSPLVLIAGLLFLIFYSQKKAIRKWSAAAPHIEHLVPLEAYDLDETGYWRRAPWVNGLWFGACMAAVAFVFNRTLASTAFAFILNGTIFGLLFPPSMRQQARWINAGLYFGRPWLIPPPPASMAIHYQVLCTRTDGKVPVTGILYLGPRGFLFVPPKRNFSAKSQLEMSPVDSILIALVTLPAAGIVQRMLTLHRPGQIEITCNGATARFSAPQPAITFAKLSTCLKLLQDTPA